MSKFILDGDKPYGFLIDGLLPYAKKDELGAETSETEPPNNLID
jgi:hypothetical protein